MLICGSYDQKTKVAVFLEHGVYFVLLAKKDNRRR